MGERSGPGQRREPSELGRLIALLAGRAAWLAATLAVTSVIVFVAMDVLPGDPAAVALGTGARADTLAALRHAMQLDRPAVWRYLGWVGGLLRGDFGESLGYHVPVADLLARRVWVSLPLALAAAGLSAAIAVPLGVFAARRGGVADAAAMGLAQLGVAIPNFWLGLLLVLGFAVALPWFPAGGFPGWDRPLPALRALVLPTLALALPQAAVLARVVRGAVAEAAGSDMVRAARARGLSSRAALWRHAVPNALAPSLTVFGLQVSFLLVGAVVVEQVFSLPGLGRLMFQAIAARDFPVVQDLVLLLAGCVVLVNGLIDLAQAAIDPRLRG